MALNADDIAKRSTEPHWAADRASQSLGIRLISVGPGTAAVRLLVEERHLMGQGLCHGGIIFSLADSAFAYACNSYNRLTVAQHCNISYIAPGHLGDELTATALEASLAGRSGIYDVEIRRGDGTLIALFRGCSRQVRGRHFSEDEAEREGST